MQLDLIKKIINNLKEVIEVKYKAKIIGIFGSYARGEEKNKSDIDILVEFSKGADLIDLIGLSYFLEDKLGIKVDIVPINSLREEIRDYIIKDLIYL